MSHDDPIHCGHRLVLTALTGIGILGPGSDLAAETLRALDRQRVVLESGDVLCVASKLISRLEGRFVDLSTVSVSSAALELARRTSLEPAVVELVLRESAEVSRVAKGALVVRNRLGVIAGNAGVDLSNAVPPEASSGAGPFALLLPEDPDRSAAALRDALERATRTALGVVVTDSVGRPFRLGSVGIAIGVSGLPPLFDQRGRVDLFGKNLEHTMTALADQVAAAADLVAGQAAEGRCIVHVRGLRFTAREATARDLLRPPDQDLYAGPGGGRSA